MEEDYWECINYIRCNGKLIYQKDPIGIPTREETTCSNIQAVRLQLMQEADKK